MPGEVIERERKKKNGATNFPSLSLLGHLWVEMGIEEAEREEEGNWAVKNDPQFFFLFPAQLPFTLTCLLLECRGQTREVYLCHLQGKVWFYFNFSFLCFLGAALTSTNLLYLWELNSCYLSPCILTERGKKNYPFEVKVGERESHIKRPANVKFGLAPICKRFKYTLDHFLLLHFFSSLSHF